MPIRGFRAPSGVVLAAAAALSVLPAVVSPAAAQSTGSSSSLSGSSVLPGSSDDGSDAGAGVPTENDGLYEGSVEVVDGEAEDQSVITGQVFNDADRDSSLSDEESGIEGVTVSNGIDVTTTDEDGRYTLPARDNMSVTVTQPAGWQVPVDESKFAQFSYEHYKDGSPDLKFGGLDATGPVPTAVNFPLAESEATAAADQSCPIAADTQTYDKDEVEYARKGGVADLMARDDYAGCGILLLGDNVGDDLSLNPDLRDLYSQANGPVRALPGNHDMDYDAADDVNATDTYRRDFGATYYSYDVGETHFVALDNIVYNGDDGSGKGGYLEKIPDEQLEWLKNDLAQVDNDKQIVINAHAPIVNYKEVITDNANDLYDILADYPNAFTVGGHTHTRETLLAGEKRAEWAEYEESPIEELSHDQLVAGAVSGDWYSGELNDNGVPYAYTSDAAEPGVLTLGFSGSDRSESYTVRNEDPDHQFLTGINSPAWREWADRASQWQDNDKQGDAPGEIDPLTVSREDVAGGDSFVTTSFFSGSTDSEVSIALDDGDATPVEITQPAEGEALNAGWDFTETVSATHNLSSTGNVAGSSPHLWRLALPEDLEAGEHTATVTATDRYGNEFTDTVTFTVTE